MIQLWITHKPFKNLVHTCVYVGLKYSPNNTIIASLGTKSAFARHEMVIRNFWIIQVVHAAYEKISGKYLAGPDDITDRRCNDCSNKLETLELRNDHRICLSLGLKLRSRALTRALTIAS